MTTLKPQQWKILSVLADGTAHHVSYLSRLVGLKPQLLNGFWQKMPAHIRGLLRQQDGQWRLIRPLAVFDEATICQIGDKHGFQTALLPFCTSSNDEILALARESAEKAHQTLYIAHEQSQSRGRQGRRWQYRVGECMMFSFGWAFNTQQHELGALSLVAGLACQKAFSKLGINAQIKWPNDLVVGRDKLGGILIETVRNGGKSIAVVGIGINFVLPRDVENTTSIQTLLQTTLQRGLSAYRVMDAVLDELKQSFEQFEQQGFAPMVSAYLAANRDYQRPVLLLHEGKVIHEGIVNGVTEQGALRLQTNQSEQIIVSGEISLRPNDNPLPVATQQQEYYLLLDGGNSQLKWTWVGNGNFVEVKRAPYRDLSLLCEEWKQYGDKVTRIVGCAVCGEVKKAAVEAQFNQPVEWLTSMTQGLGIRNHYRYVEEHGSDRWFNALGSRRFSQNACVVVSCGTAVTTDALTDDNHYLGGTIMPGFHLMKEAMALKTANLNRPIGKVYPFPTTTSNALASGMIDAVCGAVMIMHSRLKQRVGKEKPVDVIITGGGAAKVVNALPEIFVLANTVKIVDNLVIHGLLNWIEQK